MLLEAKDLVKSYGGRTVVDRVNYSVDAGEIVGLLGSNGAGKTTSFRITVGMIKPEGGTIHFDIDAFKKHCLLNGLDDIALTMENEGRITDFEDGHKTAQPWLAG